MTKKNKIGKKNNFLLLFKNALKQAFRNKIQLISLTVLVLLSSTIFSLMQTSVARVNNEYQALISENQSNIHDFIFDPYNTVKRKDAPAPIAPPTNPPDQNAILEEQQLYLNQAANIVDNQFIWERVETRTLELNNNDNPKILKLITYNENSRIDKLIISQGFNIGKNPQETTPEAKQVVVNKEFAQKNNLQIGNTIRIYEDIYGANLKVNDEYDINDAKYKTFNWLKIVGFGTSADFITPIIDQTTPLPNKLREGILYIHPEQFGLSKLTNVDNNTLWYYNKSKELVTISSNSDVEIYYVGKSNTKEKNNIEKIDDDFFKKRYSNSSAKLVYALGDSSYRFNNRTMTLASTIEGFTTLLIALLLIVLIITGITVLLITFKNIDNSKPQIGILKSLGYSNWKILITSLAYPMLASLIGTMLVFFPASGLQILVVNTFANYFNLNFGKFVFDGLGYLYCLLLTFGFLSLVAWVISALTVIKSPIALINNISVTRDTKFTKFVKKASANSNFLTRFRLALFTSSVGKIAAVSLTMFLGTTLMTTAIIGPKIMSDNEKVTYTGMNYKSLTEYVNPTYNSPFSFYKTYNPNNKPYTDKVEPWRYITESDNSYNHPDRSSELYIKELLNNDINSEAYAPIAPNPKENPILPFNHPLIKLSQNGLTYLYGKMFTKSFLTSLEKSTVDNFFTSIIINKIVNVAWPEAIEIYNIANLPSSQSLYTLDNYRTVRTFYISYRSTISMDLNSKVQDNNDSNKLDKTKLKNFAKLTRGWKADTNGFENELNTFEFDTSNDKYPRHIQNEDEILTNPEPIDEAFQNQWIRKTMLWFYSIFYNRVGQAVNQGTYTKSPYFIKQNIAKAFENPDDQFNISFNVVPFDKTTDELGTYFIGTPEQKFNNNPYPIKVYGLQNQKKLSRPSYMQLYDSNGNSLNPVLERTNSDGSINIVINQTIAKQLRMKVNQTFDMTPNGNIMKINQDKIDIDAINFTNINNNYEAENENNASLLNQNTSYNQITSTSNGAYVSEGNEATAMLEEVNDGNVVINKADKEKYKFKIAGIYNGYGQPAAYISKNNADNLLHFDESKKAFFEIFKHEWKDKGIINDIDFNNLVNNYPTYQSLLDAVKNNNPEARLLETMLNNEFPVFNFKFSTSEELSDITKTFSVSQPYGDYSPFALNGGTDGGITYQGYGEGSAVNILPLYVHKQLLDQISQLVNTILLFFIIFSLVISFFIILLTSNLVIYENRKIIATMKTLGYSDAKITNIVIGMYLPIILIMWIIASPIGWLIVRYIINYLAYNTTWVLPLFFVWWLPLIVGLIVLGIYGITFAIEWAAMKKIKPLKILNETN